MRALLHSFLASVFCLFALIPARAQSSAAVVAPIGEPITAGALPSRSDKRIETIHFEDAGSRIDEVRFGGETHSITVQPLNSRMPAYEIVPANGARNRPIGERDSASGNSGQRVWKLFGF